MPLRRISHSMYEKFVALLREKVPAKIPVETGEFGAMMDVELGQRRAGDV